MPSSVSAGSKDLAVPGGTGRYRWWLVVAAVYAGAITLASSVGSSKLPAGAIWNFDKFIHFAAFAGLAGLLILGLGRRVIVGRWVGTCVVVAFVVGFGAIDEWHQSYVPGRVASVADWLADGLGAAFGAVGTRLWLARASGPAAS